MFEQFKENREVIKILSKLNKENSTGYIVGGAVRDTLLGIEPHDIDFATNMEYSKLKELFSEYKCNETGKAFGVLRIKTPENEYEIAQYRKDLTSNDVEFVNKIEDDLSRRDFTINAMAWNESDGIIDKFGGKRDIWNKTLKFVGNPSERIQEDPLRMLRAVRFVAKTGFTLDKDSFEALKKNTHLIKNVAKERIHDELVRTLKQDNYINAVKVMKESGLLSEIIPEIKSQYGYNQNNPHHSFDLWTHTENVLKNCKNCDYITKLVEKHMDFHRSESDKTIRKMVHNIGKENTLRLAKLSFADDEGKFKENRHNNLLEKVQKVIDEFDIPKVSDLKLTGFDLMQMGFNGKEIGDVKKYLLSEVLDNGIPNDKETLSEIVKDKFIEKEKNLSYETEREI
jgi:poly(A) polymerase